MGPVVLEAASERLGQLWSGLFCWSADSVRTVAFRAADFLAGVVFFAPVVFVAEAFLAAGLSGESGLDSAFGGVLVLADRGGASVVASVGEDGGVDGRGAVGACGSVAASEAAS
ncbi:MAG TPA: hypothetical protein VK925_12885, partial [Jiangellaceae bacterium]|nr:hypothetical protein [Jiangellaceae bacterium]